jgi:hypothetical protein
MRVVVGPRIHPSAAARRLFVQANMPEGCSPACALDRKIDESDVFFLFWSTAAKQSEWVVKEVRYAIERHEGNDMLLRKSFR